jgi:hypothetical protein
MSKVEVEIEMLSCIKARVVNEKDCPGPTTLSDLSLINLRFLHHYVVSEPESSSREA